MRDEGRRKLLGNIFGVVLPLATILAVLLLVPGAAATPVPQVDRDGDGMDDSWEEKYGLNTSRDDSMEDPDGDGVKNIQEYKDDTDPFHPDASSKDIERNKNLLLLGIGIAVGIAGIASSVGIGIAGSTASGAAAEKPDLKAKMMIFESLPMTQGVYALVITILLLPALEKTSVMSQQAVGFAGLAVGIAYGLSSVSAIPQGMIASASISAMSRNKEIFGFGLIYTVISETLALFGLIAAIFIMIYSGLR
ncbi:MAG: hypothetical protein DRN40_05355 [Thermoplasmata archaeon]|nr:MAG: hypothetical protein DRN40_05355 [Thermoplasmata archaeon]